jgi:hypothetical protein
LGLNGAGRFAVGALTVGAIFEMMRPNYAWAQQVAKVTHPASARVLDPHAHVFKDVPAALNVRGVWSFYMRYRADLSGVGLRHGDNNSIGIPFVPFY